MRPLATFDEVEAGPWIVSAERILTVDDAKPAAEAMLIDRGRILAIGSVKEIERDRRSAEAERVAFPDAVVVPGFVDAHAHPLMYGQLLTWVDVSPSKASTIPEIIRLMSDGARRLRPGVPVRGYGYEQRNLQERRHPTKHELDQIATDREVYVMNASGHGGVVNSFTLARFGITRDTPNPAGGEFFRDADGELTGELSDAACNILTGVHGVKVGKHGPNFHLADEPAEHQRQLNLAQREFLAGGVTAIGDAQVSKREFAAWLEMADHGSLSVRVSMYFLSHLLEQVSDLGLTGPFGNAFLSAAGVKFYADGTLGGWTAYFPEGYAGDPCRTGQLYHEPAEYAALVRRAHLEGLQTCTHAQSPTAITMVVDAIESALAERPDPDARHRIEHCGLPRNADITRMAALGIRPVNQPQHHFNWGEGVQQAIGKPGARFNPLGEFLAAGVPATISSDAPVADPRPLEAMQAAVTRVTRRGTALGDPSLRIDATAALRAHTIEGAISLGRERELGSLSVGKRADFVVLSANPLHVPHEQIAAIQVLETWVDGSRRFTAERHRAGLLGEAIQAANEPQGFGASAAAGQAVTNYRALEALNCGLQPRLISPGIGLSF